MILKDLVQNIKSEWQLELLSREIENLLCFYLKLSWSELQLNSNRNVSGSEKMKILEALEKLKMGTPLAYITGEQYFYKSIFTVNQNVLIPRPETELLVEIATKVLSDSPSVVMDLGSGSGCIGLSIAKEKLRSEVWLIDCDGSALDVAKHNQERLQLANVHLQKGQVGSEAFALPNLAQLVDVIVANPPYIAEGDERVHWRVHQFEPHIALYAPNNGLKWIHKWLEWGYDYLKPEGVFIFEFGQGQDEKIKEFLQNTFYKNIEFVKDYSGINRICKLTK